MTNKFMEAIEAIKAGTVNEKGEKKAVTFNRNAFEDVVSSLVNTPDYEVETAIKDEEAESGYKVVTTKPVAELRKSLEQFLIDAGVDKAEAAHQTQTAEIKKLNGIYEIFSEALYQYLKAGKKFNFLTKPDFQGSLEFQTIDEAIKEFPNPASETNEKVKKKQGKHTKVKATSKVPSWLSHKI